MTNELKISVKGKKLGRVASEIAHILLGKNSTDFAKNKVSNIKVYIDDINEMAISDKQMNEKEYQRYSGYPGGRKVKLMKQVVAQKGYGEILRNAIYNMLPANKLRKPRMKNLIIKD